MLDAMALSDESERDAFGGRSIAMGVARRWSFQSASTASGVSVAVDADIVDYDAISEVLSVSVATVAAMPITELVIRLYARLGADFVKSLHGGFAFALWDERQRILVLGIDRLGIKSLYWYREGDRLLFASRAGAVRSVKNSPEANPDAILQFLLFASCRPP